MIIQCPASFSISAPKDTNALDALIAAAGVGAAPVKSEIQKKTLQPRLGDLAGDGVDGEGLLPRSTFV